VIGQIEIEKESSVTQSYRFKLSRVSVGSIQGLSQGGRGESPSSVLKIRERERERGEGEIRRCMKGGVARGISSSWRQTGNEVAVVLQGEITIIIARSNQRAVPADHDLRI